MTKRLIVNADDFGLTPGVNRGVIDAFRFGIVRSTSLMVNMPGFEDAIALARQFPELKVGLHLNLTYGKPVLDPCRVPSLVDEWGRYAKDKARIRDRAKLQEIGAEFEAQARRFLSAGLVMNHIDTHHDLHRLDNVLVWVAALASRLEVPVRCLDADSLAARGIPSRGRFVNYFGGSEAARRLHLIIESLSEGTAEIPCHPGYVDGDLSAVSTLVDERRWELAALMDASVRQKVEECRVLLTGS